MARPRKPIEHHIASGSISKNPARFKHLAGVPVVAEVLGEPPETMTIEERMAWAEIADLAPWLKKADRIAVEVAAALLAKFRMAGPSLIAPALITRLESTLGRLGLTPADRSRIDMRAAPEATNRFAKNGVKPAKPTAQPARG